MNFSEAISYLYGLGHEVLAAKYGLESTRLLLEKLERPDLSFHSVIVAGTNGKGSVAAMIESNVDPVVPVTDTFTVAPVGSVPSLAV